MKYKEGVDNVATGPLSRVQEVGELMQSIVVIMTTELASRIVASWDADMSLKAIIEDLQAGRESKKHYIWVTGQC